MELTSGSKSQLRIRTLGTTELQVSALGVGTNKWRHGRNDAAVFETYRTFQDGGISFFDTAEIYSFGRSERLLGDCMRRDGRRAIVASKFMPFIARSSPRQLLSALDGSLARLGVTRVDLYMIHFPFPFADLNALADAMAEAVKADKARHVGVSNFSAEQMRRIADRLARSGISLAANEVQYSLLARAPESNGVLDACRELGASLIAYFPLARGRLAKPLGDQSGGNSVQNVIAAIAAARAVTPSQVALNWLLARDPCVIPIPGASRVENAKQNLGALGWELTELELAAIDAASTSRH
jgi:aryl-alcohol dehydrogenase-like predicted oxidoreductase